MEKLQSALNRAREQRKSGPGKEPLSRSATKPSRATSDTDALWEALTPFKPSQKLLQDNRIIAFKAGAAATPFDILRTKILMQMRRNNWSRLAITSPTPRCGKTTAACNFAAGLSRHPDIRSILFDLDLRRPAVGKYIGYRPEHGIRQLLQGKVSLQQQAVRFRNNTAICAARSPIVDPTTLLLNDTTTEVFDNIQATYKPDIMTFDLPPFLVSDDTRAFLKNVDCALVMISAGETTVSQVDICEREISQHTNVLGLVLNADKYPEESQGYEYENY